MTGPVETEFAPEPAIGNTVEPSKKSRAEAGDLGVLWTLATVTGILAISYVPIAADSPRPWLRMVLPVVAMGAYLSIAWGRARHSRQRVADSLYFMGFLWTLWALIDALSSRKGPSSQMIYTAFGYALIGTFSGMFGRLLLMQFARDLETQEHEAADRIDDRVNQLVISLNEATQQLNSFSASVGPSGELRTALSKSAASWSEEAKNAAIAVTASTKAGIREGTEQLASALTALGQQSALIGTQLQTVNLELSDPATEFVKTVKGMSSKTKVQADSLLGALQQLEQAIAGLSSDPKLTQALSNLVSAIATAEMAVAGTTTSVQGSGQRFTETATRVSSTLVESARAVASTTNALTATSAQVSSAVTHLSSASAAAAKDVGEVDRVLRDVVDFVDKQVVNRQ